MIRKTLQWVIHWFGQGLKLWLFATVASICTVPIFLPWGFLEQWAKHFDQIGLLPQAGIVSGYLACFAVGIAVFTAVLASQLKDNPLRPFVPRRATPDEPGRMNRSVSV